ncbi:MAG: phosphatase PAP2 family protein [Kofleriaceae bacterium]
MVELPRIARHPAPRWLLWVAAASALLTIVCILFVDQPVARRLAEYEPAAFWGRGIDALEWAVGLPVFRWLSGVILVLGMIVTVCVPRLRLHAPAWMFLAASHVIAQVATRYLKEWTGRLRPLEWMKQGGTDTFLWESGVSFPSGHVTIFASVVIPFVALFPRWWPLLGVAAFAMGARVAMSAHFLSDVFGAITLVTVIVWVCGWAIRPCRP